MTFSANPLSLSVSGPALESWLRESGYLETLDCQNAHPPVDRKEGLSLSTVTSFLTINPFSKLTDEDYAKPAAPWTTEFFHSVAGPSESYSLPSSSSQARLRVQENVNRYLHNYIIIYLVIVACTMYQVPITLVGILSTFLLWDLFRQLSKRWGLDRFQTVQHLIMRLVQFATITILMYCKVTVAVFWSTVLGFAVMILHSSLRKLTPMKKPPQLERRRTKVQPSKPQILNFGLLSRHDAEQCTSFVLFTISPEIFVEKKEMMMKYGRDVLDIVYPIQTSYNIDLLNRNSPF